MAAVALPEIGTELGPCAEGCEHTDCAATRRMAARLCPYCTEAIGYGRPFYNVTPDGDPASSVLAHADCEEAAVARAASGRQL